LVVICHDRLQRPKAAGDDRQKTANSGQSLL
jgi:hypothetical protein